MIKGPGLTAWPVFELTTETKEDRVAAAQETSKEVVDKCRPAVYEENYKGPQQRARAVFSTPWAVADSL